MENNKNMEEKILRIIESYGSEVDYQGWQIPERFEAIEEIMRLLNNK